MTTPATPGDRSSDEVLAHRPRLLGLAYRMLGDVDEAEDVVQEAYLRWHQADRQAVRSAEAWMVTVVSRLAVDRLRRLDTERAAYPGPWLPEPIATDTPAAPSALPAPDRGAELASDLSVALLVLLERLAPEERAAFLLRKVFGTDYAEIARILERRPDAVRQMVHRARAWIAGPDRVARFLLGAARKFGWSCSRRLTQLNGQPAVLVFKDGALTSALAIDVHGERIRAVHIVRNPDKLRHALETVKPIV
jgi:RNA polymerase sigma factor (sigma-70 family)